MIQYSSIPHLKDAKILNQKVYSFYKYDGSNLRFEWQPKKGFCKFGSRTQMIDEKTEIFGKAIPLFQETMSKEVIERITDFYGKKVMNSCERVVVFAEFFGKNSFAGNHEESDEKQLKIFDINMYKKGILPPQEFIKIFNDYENSAELLYYGNLNQEYISSVNLNIDNKLEEGVICKSIIKNQVHMTKVKTHQWIDRLKGKFTDWEHRL